MNRQRQMQKALNHVNKAIMRIDKVAEDSVKDEPNFPGEAGRWFYLGWDLASFRQRLLVAASMENIELDATGMPQPNRKT